MAKSRPFLTAEWRYLVMLNYDVPPGLLEPYVPAGTILDLWQGKTYVSLVGFLFQNTRLLGCPIPGHRHFEELNLRFYVRREVDGEVRRGVTFLKELVPRSAIARVARRVYNEPYESRPMRHSMIPPASSGGLPSRVEYSWREDAGQWGRISFIPAGPPESLVPGSEAEFITEHYWGYTRQRDGGTIEYQVTHPAWQVAPAASTAVEGDLETLSGASLATFLRGGPTSAFLATGSAVTVYRPVRIPIR